MRDKSLSTEQREQLRRAFTTGADVALDSAGVELAVLDAGGAATRLTNADRAGLLQRLRAGEHIELEANITAFIQRDTPNRNFVRIKPGALPMMSTSFRGQPFLRDHASYELDARGGTILDSTFKHNEDGSKAISMRVKAVKPWAVEGLLDGTIDRFSIGFRRTGPVLCSLDEQPLYGRGCCDHWPGDLVDGKVCEALYTAAEGTEVSAVNVPAVVGTGIEAVRGLAGEFDGRAVLAAILGADFPPEIAPMKLPIFLLAALSLGEEATADQATERAKALATDLATARTEEALLRARLSEAQASVTSLTTQLATSAEAGRKTTIDQGIAKLYGSRKLQVVVDGDNPVEKHLRAIGANDIKLFEARCAEIAAGPDVNPAGKLGELNKDVTKEERTGGTALTEDAKRWMRKAGLSEKEIEAHGTKHLDRLAGVG